MSSFKSRENSRISGEEEDESSKLNKIHKFLKEGKFQDLLDFIESGNLIHSELNYILERSLDFYTLSNQCLEVIEQALL